ncbi:Endochitinase [Halotydeus destructor]|nr:Endochitinase [Halotydeus destructor]
MFVDSSVPMTVLNCNGMFDEVSKYSENMTTYISHCSYLTLGNVKIEQYGSLTIPPFNLEHLKAMRKEYPTVKFLIGVRFRFNYTVARMTSSMEFRSMMIESLLHLAENINFDGFVFGHYPAFIDTSTNNSALVDFLKLIGNSSRTDYVIGVTGGRFRTPSSAFQYDCEALDDVVTFIELRTYDYISDNASLAGHHAPLGPLEPFDKREQGSNIKTTVGQWAASCPKLKPKLLLTVVTIGMLQTFQGTTRDRSRGPFSLVNSTNSLVWYNGICQYPQTWYRGWDAPVVTDGTHWISFDNHESIRLKLDYASAQGLAGVSYHSFETDAFTGSCWSETGPLLSTIVDYVELHRANTTVTNTESSTGPDDQPTETAVSRGPSYQDTSVVYDKTTSLAPMTVSSEPETTPVTSGLTALVTGPPELLVTVTATSAGTTTMWKTTDGHDVVDVIGKLSDEVTIVICIALVLLAATVICVIAIVKYINRRKIEGKFLVRYFRHEDEPDLTAISD